MTTKERLHQLVDQLGDDQADELLRVASALANVATDRPARPRPRWVGMIQAEPDLAARSSQILREELTR